jgi:hypothetical protein
LEDSLDSGELGWGNPIVVDKGLIVVSWFGFELQVAVLERGVEARVEEGFGF